MPRPDTRGADYSERLETLEGAGWKRALDVQAPYRWNLRRLGLGLTLDIGCGIGRNLSHLEGVGIDHNASSIEVARRRGCTAYTPDEFGASSDARAGRFDSLLFAHVLEHMRFNEARDLLGQNLQWLRPAGQVVLITPQEAGYRSDETHVEYMDFDALHRLSDAHGLRVERSYSFPFPRLIGRVFPHNEFVVVARASAQPEVLRDAP